MENPSAAMFENMIYALSGFVKLNATITVVNHCDSCGGNGTYPQVQYNDFNEPIPGAIEITKECKYCNGSGKTQTVGTFDIEKTAAAKEPKSKPKNS